MNRITLAAAIILTGCNVTTRPDGTTQYHIGVFGGCERVCRDCLTDAELAALANSLEWILLLERCHESL